MQDIEIESHSSAPTTGEDSEIRAAWTALVASRPALLWVLAVIAGVIWRPLVMGFYTDDWNVIVGSAQVGAAFSWARLLQTFHIDKPRIGMLPLWFLLSSLCSDEKLLWHMGLLIANMAVIVVLVVLAAVFSNRRGAGVLFPSLVALSWIILPWNAPLQFWPTMLPAVFTLTGFAICAILLLKECKSAPARYHGACILAGLLYLWVCTSYEVYYFQFLPVLLLLSVVLAGRLPIRRLLPAGLSLVGAQGAAVVWYFVAKRLTKAQQPIPYNWYETLGLNLVQRPVVGDWYAILGHNLAAIPSAVIKSTWETRNVVVAAAAVWLAYSAYVWFRAWQSPAERPEARRTILAVLACGLGALLSIAAFSMGGRTVYGVGVDARTFFLFSFWVVLLVCLVTNFVAAQKRFRRAYLGVALILGVALLLGDLQRTLDWSRAWRLQQQVLAETPLSQMKDSPGNARILLVNPIDSNGAPIFLQPWDIDPAMHIVHPSTAGQYFFVYNRWLGPMVWDGKRLSYPLFPDVHLFGSDRPLYVWVPRQAEYWKAGAPFQINPDTTLQYLDK